MKPYELPALDYDYAALEPHYSARVLELHHDKHHKAYVDGVNTTLEKLAARARVRRPERDRRPREDARVQPVRPRAAHVVLEEPLARRRRQARRRARGRDRRALRLVRRVQEAAVAVDVDRAGLGLGRAHVGAARRAAVHRADLRPPGQHRPRRRAAARDRRVGARVLPAVREPPRRLRRGDLERHRLGRRRGALRTRPAASSSST